MRSSVKCHSCSSKKQKVFSGEIAIHFEGRDGLNKPLVYVFPQLTICIECGMAQFNIPERELQVLVTGEPVDGATVLQAAA